MKHQITKDGERFVARCVDHIGPVGPVFYGFTKEEAIFGLGVLYGRLPQEFSRPLEQIEDPAVAI